VPRYLIFLEADADGWHLERDSLMERLAADWPDAIPVPASEMGITELRDVGWTYLLDGMSIEGWSARSGLGLVLDGADELVMRFAAWFRQLVPSDVELTFCDDGYFVHVNVPSEASAEDIARLYAEA
jgi:hypothetical protein